MCGIVLLNVGQNQIVHFNITCQSSLSKNAIHDFNINTEISVILKYLLRNINSTNITSVK